MDIKRAEKGGFCISSSKSVYYALWIVSLFRSGSLLLLQIRFHTVVNNCGFSGSEVDSPHRYHKNPACIKVSRLMNQLYENTTFLQLIVSVFL